MAKSGPFSSLADEETLHFKWFEAFMHRRIELEQQMVSALHALLENAPPLPDRMMSWHRALEKLLKGTRDELHTRMYGLEMLKGHMQNVGMSITNAEMCIRDLNFEFENLESTKSTDPAQAATATLHKNWLDIESVEVRIQKGFSNLFSSGRAQKAKLEMKKELQDRKAREALKKYYEQDLTYRRTVHQKRQSQKQFLNSIPDRVQEYGTRYWIAVRDVGMVMESFANYLRDLSFSCNFSGSDMWASVKDIEPLVDANCLIEAVEIAYHQSTQFSPIHYRNPGSTSHSPSGQTILFGCPLELRTIGELAKAPPVLEYLLDSVRDWPRPIFRSFAMEEHWTLVNELEQAWTGLEAEKNDGISNLVSQHDYSALIVGYFMALPEPILSGDDNPSSLISNTWSKDPTKLAVLRAVTSCWNRLDLGAAYFFGADIVDALAQKSINFDLTDILEHNHSWIPPISNAPEENH